MDLGPPPARVIITSFAASDAWRPSAQAEAGAALARAEGRGCSTPSVCIDLSANHTHDLLLDLGVLSIDVGISDLAVFVPVGSKEGA